jgi:hypothetical protein
MKIICLWSILFANTLFAKPQKVLDTQQVTIENLQTLFRDIAKYNVDFSDLNRAEIHNLPVLKALQYFLNETSRSGGVQVMEALSILITQMRPADLAKLETLFAPRRKDPQDSTIALAAMEVKLTQSIRILSQALARIKPAKNSDIKRPADFSLEDFSLWLQNTQSLIHEHSIDFRRNQLKTFFLASPKETFPSIISFIRLKGVPVNKILIFKSLNYFIKYKLKPIDQESVVTRICKIFDTMKPEEIEIFYSEITKVPKYDRTLDRQRYISDSYIEAHETLINLLDLLDSYNKSMQISDNIGKDALSKTITDITSLISNKISNDKYESFLEDEEFFRNSLKPITDMGSIIVRKVYKKGYEVFIQSKETGSQSSQSITDLQNIFEINLSPEMSLASLHSYSKPEALIFLLTLGYGNLIKSNNRILPYELIERLKKLSEKFSEEEVQIALTKLQTHPGIPQKIDHYEGYLSDFCLLNTNETLEFIIDLLIKYNETVVDPLKNSKKEIANTLKASKKNIRNLPKKCSQYRKI